MLDVIVDPEHFFEGTTADRLDGSVLIVGTASVTNVLGVIILLAASWTTIVEAGPFVTSTYLLSVLSGIGGVIGSWVIHSAVFHGISGVFGGEGSFRTTLTYAGWGFVPIACGGLLKAGLILVTVWGVTFPRDVEKLGPFVRQATSGPSFTLMAVLSIVLTVWSGSIWTFAVSHARNISLGRAAITVAIPLSLWISWRLYSLPVL